MYEPITVQIDRGYGEEGTYRSYTINFTGRLVKSIQAGSLTMRLYEWANYRDDVVYLVHDEEDKPGRLPDVPSTRSSTPTRPGPRPQRDTPPRKFLGLTRNSPT